RSQRGATPRHATMKTIHLLLGSSERRISNIVEVAVRDVCYEQAVVDCFRTPCLSDFTQRGCIEAFDLIVITPAHVLPGPFRRNSRNMIEESVRAIQSIKEHRQVPIIGVAVP